MKTVNKCAGALAALVTVGFAFPAHAIDRFVPGQFSTIQAAIDAADNNDTIFVAPGTYNESLDFGVKNIRLRSTGGPEVTTIDASGEGASVIEISGGQGAQTVVEGFTLTGGTGSPGFGFRGMRGGSGLRGGSTVGGAMKITQSSSPVVRHCIMHDNSATDGGAVFIQDSAQPDFYNCLIYDNVASDQGGAVYSAQSLPSFFVCTIANNVASTAGAMYATQQSFPLINGCILWSNGFSPVVAGSQTTVFYSYSNVQLNGGSVPEGGGNMNQNPQFLNANNDRYELQSDSPCIDAGDSVSIASLIAKDLLGNSRGVNDPDTPDTGIALFDVVSDMGAFEFPIVCVVVECPGDTNADNIVNVGDLLEVINNWGAICD